MNTRLLNVIGLTKSLGTGISKLSVLGGISLNMAQGEFVSIVGPSGCGKTTLLMCLSGLYRADSGRVEFNGVEVKGPTAGVSIVFQDYSRSLLPWKSVADNVLFGMYREGDTPSREKRDRASELLNAVGLRGFESRYPWELSGGMQQRVAIARGLASRPQLLLLDEPLAAVDAQTRAEMQDLILTLAARYQQSCLLITHDVDEAIYMANRIIVLSNRPTKVVCEIDVDLPENRDQLETREDPTFLRIRHQVISLIRGMRTPVELEHTQGASR
ncbi:MAG: ABC transporter ATP-binding protein [Pigmentiphaga sp.]|nr:ABC transporter ATP-binding protein [Pigmentiphaga sp.]